MVGTKITKAVTLRSALAFHLRGVRLYVGKRHLRPDLTEDQRYEIAEKVIDVLRRQGWKELDDELQPLRFFCRSQVWLGEIVI